jgi:hypothetical protein
MYGRGLGHPSEADYLVPEQFSFYSVRLLVSRPTPNLEDQGITFRLALLVWGFYPVLRNHFHPCKYVKNMWKPRFRCLPARSSEVQHSPVVKDYVL